MGNDFFYVCVYVLCAGKDNVGMTKSCSVMFACDIIYFVYSSHYEFIVLSIVMLLV